MVRNFKRKTERGNVPADVMLRAVRRVQQGNCSIRSVAEEFGINYRTLTRYTHKFSTEEVTGSSVQPTTSVGYCKNRILSADLETALVEYIERASDIHQGLSPSEVRKLAYQVALANDVKVPASWTESEQAGYEWFTAFLKRNPPLSMQLPEATSLARASSFNKTKANIPTEPFDWSMADVKLEDEDGWIPDADGIREEGCMRPAWQDTDEQDTEEDFHPCDSGITVKVEVDDGGDTIDAQQEVRDEPDESIIVKVEVEDEDNIDNTMQELEEDSTSGSEGQRVRDLVLREKGCQLQRITRQGCQFEVTQGDKLVVNTKPVASYRGESNDGFSERSTKSQQASKSWSEESMDQDARHAQAVRHTSTSRANFGPAQRLHTGGELVLGEDEEETFSPSEEAKEYQGVHIDRGSYICKFCGEGFSEVGPLVRHMRVHAQERKHRCKYCGGTFTGDGAFNLHMKMHVGDKPYKCEYCEEAFKTPRELKEHMELHPGGKPYHCKECRKAFSQVGHLNDHMRIHTGEKAYQCGYCEKAFATSSHLKRHMNSHVSQTRKYHCEHCEWAFRTAGELSRHISIHTEEKPYLCEFCGKTFRQLSRLTCHIRVHTGEKPYQCDVCEKAFIVLGQLRQHKKTHTGEKPYRCQYCSRAFTQSAHLKSHVRQHTGERPFKCKYCGKGYIQGSNLKYHMRVQCPKRMRDPDRENACGSLEIMALKMSLHKTQTP